MTDCKELPLRVLVVAPRPEETREVLTRHHLTATLDVLETQEDQVQLAHLWPTTFEALMGALAADYESPSYDVLVLDAAVAGDGILFDDQHIFPGAFGELAKQHGVALVYAQLAALSDEIDVLAQTDALMDADIGNWVAITEMPVVRYGAFTDAFWSALLAGLPIEAAIEQARRSLPRGNKVDDITCLAASATTSLVNTTPSTSASPKVIRFPSRDILPAWQRLDDLSALGGLPETPAAGLCGRAGELYELEYRIRSTEPGVTDWLYGYEGIGKTTIIAEAARWAVRTGAVERAVYTSFSDGGSVETALQALGHQLVDGRGDQGDRGGRGSRFSLRDNDPEGEIMARLAKSPTLVVWDHFDGVLSGSDTALSSERLDALVALGQRIVAVEGCHLICLSDTSDAPPEATKLNARVMPLGPMPDAEAASFVRSLAEHHCWAWAEGDSAERLAAALGGNPLALGIAVATNPEAPDAVLAEMAAILPGLSNGAARFGNQALDLAFEVLRRALPKDRLAGLWALGIFAGRFMEPMSDRVLESASARWADLEPALARAGLVSHNELPGFAVPLWRLHPAFLRYVRRNLSSQQLDALRIAYCANYTGLLRWIVQNQNKPQAPAHLLAYRELPNMRHVIDLLLGAERVTEAIEYARELEHILDVIGYQSERDAIGDAVREAAAKAVPAQGPLGRPGVQLLLHQGEQLISLGRVPEALALYQQLTQRMNQENGLSYSGSQATYDRGVAFYQLGRCMVGAGRADLAMAIFEHARDALVSLEATPPVQRQLMQLYQEMGQAHLLGSQAESASEAYHTALSLATALDDAAALGAIHAQLGAIAIGAKELDAGREHLYTALRYQQMSEDDQATATTWGQLGAIAWEGSQLDEARECFGQALAAAQKSGHIMLQAQSWLQLAQLAAQSGDPADAQSKYAQAIQLYQEHNVRPAWARAEMSLAELLLREGDLTNARIHAEAARAIVEDVGPDAHPWEVHALLERISEGEGDSAKAAVARRRAQESFFASTQARRVLQGWRPMIEGVARACLGEALSESTVELVEQLETKEEWQHLAAAIWQVLSGSRDAGLYAALDYVDAAVVRELLRLIENPALLDEEADQEKTQPPAGLTLPQLLGAVAAAISGNEQAQSMVYTVLDTMERDDAPISTRALASALRRILEGERDPALLQTLPEEMRIPLTALLSQLAMS